MLGFKPKTDEILNHWIAFADNYAIPPLEFYKAVEEELTNSKIPGLTVSKFDYREGGILSDKRIYLRLIRERLAFDVCASTFGNRFFFSCRSVYSPAVIRFRDFLAIIIFFGAISYPLYRLLGFMLASVALVGLLIAIGWIMRNTIALGMSDFDTLLLKTPALGPIYERWFRKSDTYYRDDTRLQYLEAVPNVVRKLAEEATAAKGIKLIRQYARAPVLGVLYRPCQPLEEYRRETA